MTDQQRHIAFLIHAKCNDQQHADGKTGYNICIDNRNLVGCVNKVLRKFLRIKRTNRTHRSKDCSKQR